MRPRTVASRGAALLLAAAVGPAAAQIPEPPTLADLGLEYVSPAGLIQLTLSGQLDLEGVHVRSSQPPAPEGSDACAVCHIGIGRNPQGGEGAFEVSRLRVFADLFLGDHVYSMVELRTSRGREDLSGKVRTKVEQLLLRVTGADDRIGAQVGRFASPFGSYAPRHRAVVDPFVSAPLMYEYRTVMNRWRVPGGPTGFLQWQDAPDDEDLPGAPPIWEVPYQWGAMVMGRLGAVDLRLAAMNSAPSSQPNAWKLRWDRFDRPSWVVGARWRPTPSIELGASYDRGPWMAEPTQGTILPPADSPPGTPAPGWRDFDQEAIAADIAVARGSSMLRIEGLLDRWAVPNLRERPTELGLNVEVQRDLAAGFSGALRFGTLDFRPIDDGLGASSPEPDGRRDWDHDVQRYEASLAYRLNRNMGLLLSGWRQIQDGPGWATGTFAGLRLWWAF